MKAVSLQPKATTTFGQVAQLLLLNRSSGESTSPNLLPSWTFTLWNPASSFGRAREDWSLRHHIWKPVSETCKGTLREPSCASSMSWPASDLFATAHDSNLENCFSTHCVKVEGKNNIHGGSQAWSLRFAQKAMHTISLTTKTILQDISWGHQLRGPFPAQTQGIYWLTSHHWLHTVFGVSWPMTYNSMGPGRGGSSSLNTDLPSSSVFGGAAARKLWQGEWARDVKAHDTANTVLGCCILVRKSVEALPRIEGFWLWRPSGAGTARSLGTELAVHFLCKGQQRRNRCYPWRNECYLAKNREELFSILQDLISLHCLPHP